jgi:thiamine-phosphate pyrophosphorylase
MMICLVTDRRRLSADAWTGAQRACLVAQVRHAVDAGVDLVQVRESDLEAGAQAALVADCLAIAKGTTTRIVVNDRIDVALACGAHGVHLRGDSIPIRAARQIAPAGFLIGRSVHRIEEARAAREADYLIAGTVFPTSSKGEGAPLLGIEGLRAIAEAVDRPVLAIGGISEDRLDAVASAGAAGIAAIGLFMTTGAGRTSGPCRAISMRQVVARARSRFDTLKTAF